MMNYTLTEEHCHLVTRYNAHLTFNILEAVQCLLLEQDTERAIDLVSRYSRILRELLISSKMETTLRQEMEAVSDYLEIETVRTCNGFIWSVDTDPDVYMSAVPKGLVFAFVENAVRYGLSSRYGAGSIDIAARPDIRASNTTNRNGTVVIRHLAPASNSGSGHIPGSIHGHDLIREMIAMYRQKTGRDVSFDVTNRLIHDSLAEMVVTIMF